MIRLARQPGLKNMAQGRETYGIVPATLCPAGDAANSSARAGAAASVECAFDIFLGYEGTR